MADVSTPMQISFYFWRVEMGDGAEVCGGVL